MKSERVRVSKVVAIVIMGAYADSIDFDDYDWYIEPYDVTRAKDVDVFYTSHSFILSGEMNESGKAGGWSWVVVSPPQ